MKFFAFIMAVIVLAQVCMPCDDDAIATKTGEPKPEIVQSPLHQDENDQTDGCCNFCQCVCCGGFAINHTCTAVAIPLNPGNIEFTSYLQLNLLEISFPIWQPPQLAA